MFPRKTVLKFLVRLAIVYILLAAPWPGWKDAWATVLRTMVSQVLAGQSGAREVSFEPLHERGSPVDTRIVIVNRDLMHPDGSGPVRNLDLDMGRLEMLAVALLVALILAMPASWKRRAWILPAGLLLLHGCLLGVVSFLVWRDSAEVFLVTFSPGMKELTGIFGDTLTMQSDLALPVLIWISLSWPRGGFSALRK